MPRRTRLTPAVTDEAWHAHATDEVLIRLQVGAEGLGEVEARERLDRIGPNALSPPKPVSTWKILFDQFRSVVVLLLLVAAVFAWLLGDPLEAVAVLAVLAINAFIGFFTELRARRAMAALLRLEVPRATVLRDGLVREVEAHTLVPGDVILVEAGQSVPADARLVAATELRTNEAALTGESLPANKRADVVLPADTPLAERRNLLYMSSAVVAGTGRAVVIRTGMATEVGRIGGLVGGIRDEPTPLEQRLDALGHRLVWVTLAVTAVVVGVGLLRGEALGRMISTGIALAIAAVPEGLPAVSTIALAVGVARMARRNALVRRLPSVESLGSATIVCTDKTGTLTAGEMTVTHLWVAGEDFGVTGTGYHPEGSFIRDGDPLQVAHVPTLELALRVGTLANRAALELTEGDWEIRGDPTEAALLVVARKAGFDRKALLERWPEVGEIPFSSERMVMATFHRGADGMEAYVKGAPARVIERCARLLGPSGKEVPLDDDARRTVLERNDEMAARGLRVLALARGATEIVGEEALVNLTFVGLVGMSDPPAAGVPETISRFREAGIRTVMITGDQRLTAEAVARELDILRASDEVVQGRELQGLAAEDMALRLGRASALSRVSPEEKLRIVEAFQRRGEIVAMLGDGVNDAPALKRADIGVAMGIRGTDVAKEAADLVLQDDRFQTIGAAVEEGRVIFDNIRKFVFYLFSCNVAEVFVILGASLLGLPQPLLPLQILWLNLVTDTFPALSLAVEPGEPDVMRRPPYDPKQAILSATFIRTISFYALLITAVTLAAFVWTLRRPVDPARAVTVAFMTLALAQAFHLGNARGAEPVLSWTRATANRWALAAVALTAALQLLAVYFTPLARVLGVVPLAAEDWLVIVPLAFLPAVVGQGMALVRSSRLARMAAAG